MQQRLPVLSILMLMHNDGKYLSACLQSISAKVGCSFEVVLVDNASLEQVPDEIQSMYPWLRVIRSERNLGFNAGNNLAAKHARGEYFLLLNIDTLLITDVTPALHLLESDPRVGVAGAEAYSADRVLRPSSGHFPRAWRLWIFKNLWMAPSLRYGASDRETFQVDWVEGSFLMTRRRDWDEIGGFDERYFLFGNDLHFCKAAVQLGRAVVHCTAVKYVHFCGFGSARMGHLYASFREYHRTFSSLAEQYVASFVLRLGLLVRIGAYGAWYLFTRNAFAEEKFRCFVEVRRNWAHLVP